MSPKILAPIAILVLAAGGALLLVATAPSIEYAEPERAIPAVRVIEASVQTLRHVVRSQGTVAPRTQADLIPEVSGRVVWVSPSLAVGGFFEAGAPLLRIERRDYELALERRKAAVLKANSERRFRNSELERQEGLSAGGVASPSQVADARRAAAVAEANWLDARSALEQAERDLERSELRAPFDGRVREEHVDVGQFVNRGEPVARIYATDYVEIRLPLADDQLAFLALGPAFLEPEPEPESTDPARASLPAVAAPSARGPRVRLTAKFAGRESEWTGQIVRTEGEIDARSRMVHVVARVERPYQTGAGRSPVPLAVGLFVKAEIEGPEVENVVVVPRYAMRDRNRVLVVDAENHLRSRAVEVLRIDRNDALVQGPLAPGERICISPLQIVVEGMRVRPIAEPLPAAPAETTRPESAS